MNSNLLMNFEVDKANKKINVERAFAAPIVKVWAAWTEPALLDQWWAPKPWKARTKAMDFREGGNWLYAMVGPEGEEHWARVDYETINPLTSFSAKDAFCDENGNLNDELPGSHWNNQFNEQGGQTVVSMQITFEELAHLETTLEMGFKEGFEMGLGNLDELLEKQA
ncbi:SRPBCC family protein [Dyadobacter crusticola]|uniref:SRPBCC family protein n=1 Tax=Dyadobacter crusticola TaxID=292407 RepID=UPI0004E0BD25|nr:SRPBCC domain-containing protein [Dyadobacter crusticola]